jgi:hypothetical protein
MLHALSSTFTTCACGSKAKDCALNLMADFVDGHLPTSTPSQRPDDSSGVDKRPHRVDLGPLIGAQRGFRTCETSPLNGGMNGVEMIPSSSGGAASTGTSHVSKGRQLPPSHIKIRAPAVQAISATASPSAANGQSEETCTQEVPNTFQDPGSSSCGRDLQDAVGIQTYRSPSPSDSDPQPHSEDEEQMPPKMRKRWMHRSTEGLRSASPVPSRCGSNDSLGSVLDEGQGQGQMELESSGSHAS